VLAFMALGRIAGCCPDAAEALRIRQSILEAIAGELFPEAEDPEGCFSPIDIDDAAWAPFEIYEADVAICLGCMREAPKALSRARSRGYLAAMAGLLSRQADAPLGASADIARALAEALTARAAWRLTTRTGLPLRGSIAAFHGPTDSGYQFRPDVSRREYDCVEQIKEGVLEAMRLAGGGDLVAAFCDYLSTLPLLPAIDFLTQLAAEGSVRARVQLAALLPRCATTEVSRDGAAIRQRILSCVLSLPLSSRLAHT